MNRLLLLPILVSLIGCGAIATSPAWVGGGMVVTGPPLAPEEEEDDSGEEKIGARHILIMHKASNRKPPGITRTREEALKRAQECLLKIREGADFIEMAREYTDEPGSKETGGDLGTFKRRIMVGKFSDAAFALKVGEVSEVVETSFGFHIIKRTK